MPPGVADWWCRYLLPKGGVLLDPFAGVGGVLEVGLRNGASQVIGVERSERSLDACRRRLGLTETDTTVGQPDGEWAGAEAV